MKDFYEAILMLEVKPQLEQTYKKAIEDENSRYWIHTDFKDKDGNIIKTETKPIWNGNHVSVKTGGTGLLEIGMVSHTLPRLQQQVDWYERMGATVTYRSWEG